MANPTPTLPSSLPIIDGRGVATPDFQRWWQENIAGSLDALAAAIEAQDSADAAQGAADNASVTAAAAQATADAASAGVADLIGRSIIAGDGLTGGGDLASDLTLNVGQGAGIIVTADEVAIDPTVVPQAGKSSALNIRTVTSTPTVAEDDYTLLCDADGAPFTVALPPAGTMAKRVLVIKRTNAGANDVTIDPDGAETIDGAPTLILTAQWQAVMIQSDGSGWLML